MTEVTRGKTCQVVCLTIDSETEKPKMNVVAGGCRIYVKTPSGETDIVPLTTVSALAHPVVPFLAGILGGHLFWYQVRPGVPDAATLATLDDLALAALVDRVVAEVEARKERRS